MEQKEEEQETETNEEIESFRPSDRDWSENRTLRRQLKEANVTIHELRKQIEELKKTNISNKKKLIPSSSPIIIYSIIFGIKLSPESTAILEDGKWSFYEQCLFLQGVTNNDDKIPLKVDDKCKIIKIRQKYHENQKYIKSKDIRKWEQCEMITLFLTKSISIVDVKKAIVWQFVYYLRIYINYYFKNNVQSFLDSLPISKNSKLSRGNQIYRDCCKMFGFKAAAFNPWNNGLKNCMNEWIDELYYKLYKEKEEYIFSVAPFTRCTERKDDDMFISKNFAERNDSLIKETKEIDELLEYLRCVVNAGNGKIYKGNDNKLEIIIFETALHSATIHDDMLDIVGIWDIETSKWKEFKLMKASEIKQLLINDKNTSILSARQEFKAKIHAVAAKYNDKMQNIQFKQCELDDDEQIINDDEIPYIHRPRLLFISRECTQTAIKDKVFCEPFSASTDLYIYLNWMTEMQRIDKSFKVFKSNYDYNKIVVINPGLHRMNPLKIRYIVGITNDGSAKPKFLFICKGFMTSIAIRNEYGIQERYLPLGSRANIKEIVIISGFLRDIIKMDDTLPTSIILVCYKYYDLFGIKDKLSTINIDFSKISLTTKQQKERHKNAEIPNELILSPKELQSYISEAINSNHLQIKRGILFNKQNTAYFDIKILPVPVSNNNNIAAIFDRDNKLISTAIDIYDIKTKLKLYDPSINVHEYDCFNNNITKLMIKTIKRNPGNSRKNVSLHSKKQRIIEGPFTGKISYFSHEKKYGFIALDNFKKYGKSEFIFFLQTDFTDHCEMELIKKRVKFDITKNREKKHKDEDKGINVKLI